MLRVPFARTTMSHSMCVLAVLVSTALVLVSTSVSAAKQTTAQLAATQGYVYVNLPKDGPIPTSLAIRSTTQKKTISLKLRADSSLRAYGAWVPPGQYQLAKWNALTFGEFEPFTVEAGRVTDLGSIVPIPIGGHQFVPLPLRPAETAGRVGDATAEFQPHVSSDVIEWRPSSLPKPLTVPSQQSNMGLVGQLISDHVHNVNRPPLSERLRSITEPREFLSAARSTLPPLNDDPLIDEQGTLYFGADLGQIRTRSAAGEWSSLNTGSLWAVSAIAFIDGVLVAGAGNQILLANEGRSDWKLIAQLPPTEVVSSVHRIGETWLITSIEPTVTYKALSVKGVRVYGSRAADPNDLVLLKHVVTDDTKAFFFTSTRAVVLGDYYFATAFNDVVRIKLDTLEVESIAPPAPAHGLRAHPQTHTLTAYYSRALKSRAFVSQDYGSTWKEVDAPTGLNVLQDVHFMSATEAHAVRAESGAIVVREVLTYDASKDDWKKQSSAPDGCVRLLHDSAGLPSFCVTNGGSILTHRNDRWDVEFAVE